MLGVFQGYSPYSSGTNYLLSGDDFNTDTDGTFIGYSDGNWGLIGTPFGSITSGVLTGGETISAVGDFGGSGFAIALNAASDPGDIISDVIVGGVSVNSNTGTTPSYGGYSGGIAYWAWPATLFPELTIFANYSLDVVGY